MADGNITVEVRTQAAQAEIERLRAENAKLGREAHTWWSACRDAVAEVERLRAERDTWCSLYRRAVNEANGLTNYVEDRPELRRAERNLTAIELEARDLAARKDAP